MIDTIINFFKWLFNKICACFRNCSCKSSCVDKCSSSCACDNEVKEPKK